MSKHTTDISLADIQQAVTLSSVQNFTGTFTPLGGGEVNDTFILECGSDRFVLRIGKYPDIKTLRQEADALTLLNIHHVPTLIYFNESELINGRLWVIESLVTGVQPTKLQHSQFESLGALLANVHTIRSSKEVKLDFWADFIDACKYFGDAQSLLAHPDITIRNLIRRSRNYYASFDFKPIVPALIHGDVTTSNMLVDGPNVSLIDWEFAKFKDPMADFSTMFYEDMEYNHGKWRVHITDDEKAALFKGYEKSGGVIDLDRLRVWINVDKLGAAVYLYWKLHQSRHDITDEQIVQYEHDLTNLCASLERNLP